MGDRPKVLVFDVNETLSDTKVLADRFAEIGAPGHLAATWFAQILRDGFALTSAGDKTAFAAIAALQLEATLGSAELNRPLDEAKKALMGSFAPPSAAAYRWAADVCDVEPADMMLVAAHPWIFMGPPGLVFGRRGSIEPTSNIRHTSHEQS